MEKNIYCNDNLQFESNEEFTFLLIEPNNIDKLDYNDPRYILNILDQPYVKTIKTNKDTFLANIAESLKINNFSTIDRNITTKVVSHKPDYFFEIMYLDITDPININNNTENQFSTLIDINDNTIYGSVIILKTYNPSNNDSSMTLKSMDKNDLFEIMDSRINTSVVIFEDNEYKEDIVKGDIEIFCKKLFNNEYYKKKEILFLNHNINIWYLENDFGNIAFPKLISGKIETAIFFNKISNEYRGNITLDEINKIIKLSNILDNFELKSNWISEEKDSMSRMIIKNKYRVLDYAWNENINKII